MIFANHNYKDFHNDNTEKHPVQPYSWNGWCGMANSNYDYCRQLDIENCFEFEGKCEAVELPSFHPYWRLCRLMDDMRNFYTSNEKYKACKEDPQKIKFLFNRDTTLEAIKKMVDNYSESISFLGSLKNDKIKAFISSLSKEGDL